MTVAAGEAPVTGGVRSARDTARGLLAATRPRQWLKNTLVVAAPVAAGTWWRPRPLFGMALAFVAFTAMAGAAYLVNDARDVERDRAHPTKRYRPVAAGQVSVRSAFVAAAALAAGSLGLALAGHRPALAAVVAGYAVTTLAYSSGLKHVPVVEVVLVSVGFLLRPLAGSVASGAEPSLWFLGTCGAGALMVTAGKRRSELELGGTDGVTRPALAAYSAGGLRWARRVAAAAALTFYAGWVLTRPVPVRPAAALSGLAFAALLARYGRCNEAGLGGEPERLLLADRWLQGAAVSWLAAFLVVATGA